MRSAATIDITRAEARHLETVGGALAEAFHDDPVFRWVVPEPTRRRARLPALFATFAEFFVPHHETYLAGDGTGAALWAPAGVEPIAEDQAEVFVARVGAVLEEDADRAWQLQEALDEHHPDQPAFYLQFVGVVPAQQRRGLGSRLLTTVLDRCDATGTPAFLDATSPDNRRLYARHGFETVGEIGLPQGPPLWPMWRDPRHG